MKVIVPQKKRFALAVAVALLSFATVFSQSNGAARKDERPVQLVVLGDSISWGQGLKDEHKTWFLIKDWLKQKTGRDVHVTVEAHSGAVIGSPEDSNGTTRWDLDGELSRAYPTINGQLDNAIKRFADARQVDLVLVNGCINDLDSRRLLNAANTPDHIRELAQQKCGEPMEALLTRIVNAFPSAHVVITGYYPILTEKTANDLFMRALAKRFYMPDAGAMRIDDKTLRARLIAISREWYQTSDQMLAAAARKIDTELQAKGSHQRVLFADVAFAPDNAFAAGKSRLWGFDASTLRKLLVVLTLGKVELRTNDERRRQRSELCEQILARTPNETAEQRAVREDRLLRCRLAAVGHPNRKGAAMYADAIGKLLKNLIGANGWLRESPALATPSSPQR
jgi:lysophospholipase L1-like esterase